MPNTHQGTSLDLLAVLINAKRPMCSACRPGAAKCGHHRRSLFLGRSRGVMPARGRQTFRPHKQPWRPRSRPHFAAGCHHTNVRTSYPSARSQRETAKRIFWPFLGPSIRATVLVGLTSVRGIIHTVFFIKTTQLLFVIMVFSLPVIVTGHLPQFTNYLLK